MTKITLSFTNKTDFGSVTFDAKHDLPFYEQKKLLDEPNRLRFCDSEVLLKDFRYINWSDKTELLPAKSCSLQSLNHKRPGSYRFPLAFDHTSAWRRANEIFPILILTEPYHLDKEEIEEFDHISSDVLNYKIIEPSEKSLWCPCSTYMIFWWNPKYLDFNANLYLLMKHEGCYLFEKKCKITKIKK